MVEEKIVRMIKIDDTCSKNCQKWQMVADRRFGPQKGQQHHLVCFDLPALAINHPGNSNSKILGLRSRVYFELCLSSPF